MRNSPIHNLNGLQRIFSTGREYYDKIKNIYNTGKGISDTFKRGYELLKGNSIRNLIPHSKISITI